MIGHFTKKELAEIAGYTYRRLYDIDMGLPDDQKLFVKCEDGKYDLALFVQRWVLYNVNKGASDENLSLDDVRAIHEQVKTQKTELEVARMRGELIPIEEVKALWGTVANNVVQNMLRLPSSLATQLILMDNVDLITGIIDKEIRDVLNLIAETPIPGDGSDAESESDAEEEED